MKCVLECKCFLTEIFKKLYYDVSNGSAVSKYIFLHQNIVFSYSLKYFDICWYSDLELKFMSNSSKIKIYTKMYKLNV